MRSNRFLVPLLSTIVAASGDSGHTPTGTASGAASSASGGGHGGGGGHDEGPAPSDFYDDKLSRMYILAGGSLFAVILVWVAILRFNAHIRRLTNLNNDTQRYFIPSDRFWGWMKQHVMYAPLFRTRHNREYRLSSAMNMGTLPTRFQTALLSTVIGVNVFLCCIEIGFSQDEKTVLGLLRNRSGTLAVVNLIPLVIMAGRNNPLIKLLSVSFDTWNLLHRWLGRIVVLEAITHVVCWMVSKVHTSMYISSPLNVPVDFMRIAC